MSLILLDLERYPSTVASMAAEIRTQESERAWVHRLVPRLKDALVSVALPDGQIIVSDGVRLPYSSVILAYSKDGQATSGASSYETDLLISDVGGDGSWIPRVVVECKLRGVTTHDALSYAAKATTHKHLHPYLRYGVLVGRLASIPRFLVKHGIDFDFLTTWPMDEPDEGAWRTFIAMLADEVMASRALQGLLSNSRAAAPQKYQLLRRPLLLK